MRKVVRGVLFSTAQHYPIRVISSRPSSICAERTQRLLQKKKPIRDAAVSQQSRDQLVSDRTPSFGKTSRLGATHPADQKHADANRLLRRVVCWHGDRAACALWAYQ